MRLWRLKKIFEKKSLKKAWIKKEKDVIFALPNRKELGIEKLERDFGKLKKKKEIFLKKLASLKKSCTFAAAKTSNGNGVWQAIRNRMTRS